MFRQWLAEVFSSPDWLTLLSIAGRTAIIYVLILVAVRFLGSRPLGRLSAHDLILMIVLANAVQNALVGGDTSLAGGLVSAFVLLLLNFGYTWALNRFPRLQKALVGKPVVLISEIGVRKSAMQREGITHDELMAALRNHGVGRVEDVRLAVLEVDGSISVVPRRADGQPARHRRVRGQGE